MSLNSGFSKARAAISISSPRLLRQPALPAFAASKFWAATPCAQWYTTTPPHYSCAHRARDSRSSSNAGLSVPQGAAWRASLSVSRSPLQARSRRGSRRCTGKGDEAAVYLADAESRGDPIPGATEANDGGPEQSMDYREVVAAFPADTDPIWSWRRQMVARMLTFIGPAIFIPLADPLMSVVDTVTVGQFASTTELAGLGPVTLIFTFVNYIWNSQGIATTTLVADALNRPSPDSKHPPHVEAGRVLASSLLMAAVVGALVCVFLQLFGPRLLQLTGAAPELMAPALSYLRIRALATPASFGIVVSQATLLAQRKSLLPCLVIAASAFVNLGLDMFLIVNCEMGVAGAAWATLASQYLAMGLMLTILNSRRSQVNPRWHTPSATQLKKFASSTGPLAFIYICKNVCYMSLQRAATVLPILQLAAHQPAFMLWNLCAFAVTPVEQAALAFLPAAKTERQKTEMPKLIMAAGAAFAVVAGLVSSSVPWLLPQLFSPDQRLYPFMRQMAPLGFIAMLIVGIEVAATAILISKKQYKFVTDAMCRTVLVIACYMALLSYGDFGISGVWAGLSVFYGARMVQNVPSMLKVMQQDEAPLKVSSSPPPPDPPAPNDNESSPRLSPQA